MAFDSLFFYAIVFLISSIITWTLSFHFKNPKTRLQLPPSPIPLPIIGHLHFLDSTWHQTFHRLTTHYGPIMHLRLGSIPCIIVSSSLFAKEILMTNELAFTARPITTATRNLFYDSSGFALSPYGTFWKRMKKTVMSQFLDSRNLARLQPVRSVELSLLVNLILNKADKGETVNLSEEIRKLANNVISRILFGIRCSGEDEQAKEIRGLVRQVTEILGEFNLPDFIGILRNFDLHGIGKRSKDIHRRYDGLLERIIKEREQVRKQRKEKNKGDADGNDEARDFLEILMDILEDDNADIGLTRDNVKAYMLDFLTAGTDTLGIIIEWALSELLNHPAELKKAREEIDSVVGKNKFVTESDISNLPYLQAIYKETFRLHPPIPVFDRISNQHCTIGGYDIPSNAIIFINSWSIGRDPSNWDEPLKYRPQRFMPGDANNDRTNLIDVKGQHFDLLPFGSGRRGCPGVALAVQFVPTVLGLLIQCFDWKVQGHSGDKRGSHNLIDMTERPGFTLPKVHPVILVPSARLDPFPTD